MRLLIILCAFWIPSLAFADSAVKEIDFFKKAMDESGVEYSSAKIAITYNPFNYASRVLQYLDRLAQRFDDRIAWSFYRFQFKDKNGTLQDCTAGLGYKKGYENSTRFVDIEGCNQSFLHATVLIEKAVTLGGSSVKAAQVDMDNGIKNVPSGATVDSKGPDPVNTKTTAK